ncbi:MAG TPA: right-handed parallel beta-helix repeat-containing protein [Opitutaceae bacterium]|nr:right-handed parallel beta-helix repeat-containing protein [Opitutaceae bacterium]
MRSLDLPLVLALAICCAAGAGPARALGESEPRGHLWVVAQSNVAASDDGPGTADHPFRSIAPAAAHAGPGDTILVHAGVYRERIAPTRGGEPGRYITYRAAPAERVVVTGSERWSPAWRAEGTDGGVCSAPLELRMNGTYNPYRTAYLQQPGRTLGQVFVDDARLFEMASLADLRTRPGTWWYSARDNRLYVHFPAGVRPDTAHDVEVTVRDRIFAPKTRGLGFIRIEGFIFEHAANQFPLRFWIADDPVNSYPQAGAVSTRGGHHWIIEHNVIREAKSVGLDCGYEGPRDFEGHQPVPKGVGHHLIRNNVVCDNGAAGIEAAFSPGTRIIGNDIERNNTLGNIAPECAGIKTHGFTHGLIQGNLVRDNDCAGIWLDTGADDARVCDNLILGNENQGIFVELGWGPCLVDNNVIAFTREGDGIYAHDASGVTIAHNLLYANAHAGVFLHVISPRTFNDATGKPVLVQASHERVLNNLFVDNLAAAVSLPPESPRSTGNVCDHNLYLTGSQWEWESEGFTRFILNRNGGTIAADVVPEAAEPLTLDRWRKRTGFDLHSRAVRLYTGPRKTGFLKGGAPAKGALLSELGGYFDLAEGSAVLAQICPALPQITADYNGRRLDPAHVHPGPFQQLNPGANHLILWPRIDRVERRTSDQTE